MIDEDRTMQLFGYVSGDLASKSHKKIVAVCEACGKYRVVGKGSYKELCLSCSRKGEKHPRWREKIVKTCEMCGEEFIVIPTRSQQKFCSGVCYGKRQSENFCGENNPMYGNEEARRKISASNQGIPYEEWESFAKDQPYCPKFDEACGESNRKKYDRCCFLSGMTEEENGRKLSVHHVDMNKDQGCEGHTWKLVPLSMKWHARTHTPLWTARIQYLLNHIWNPGRNNVIS